MAHKVEVTQGYAVTRTIVIEVDATDVGGAVDAVIGGSVDLPEFDDPRWVSRWELEIEDVKPA